MKPLEKVLQRLAYERLLLVHGVVPHKRRITLDEFMTAGEEEPRVMTVLPAILAHNPKIILNIENALKQHPRLKQQAEKVMAMKPTQRTFHGIPAEECRQAALTYQGYLARRRRNNRTRLFNLRLAEKDWDRLQRLSETLGTNNHSETIRQLIEERG